MKIDDSIRIEVADGVYSPSDDTYLLLELVDVEKGEKVLEIGSGSGIISMHCARKGAKVTSIDKSEKALGNTRKNAEINHLDIEVKKSDMFSNIDTKYDVVIFNPPYLPVHEDLEQDDRWDGGERGDEITLGFLENVNGYLEEEGRVYLIFSDLAPLDKIYSALEKEFKIIEKEEKRYRFESLVAYEIRPIR